LSEREALDMAEALERAATAMRIAAPQMLQVGPATCRRCYAELDCMVRTGHCGGRG
jgi:predicted Zn-ribbon and HTH transcriptional regulator